MRARGRACRARVDDSPDDDPPDDDPPEDDRRRTIHRIRRRRPCRRRRHPCRRRRLCRRDSFRRPAVLSLRFLGSSSSSPPLCALVAGSVGGFEIDVGVRRRRRPFPWRRPFLCSCSRRRVVALVGVAAAALVTIAPAAALSESRRAAACLLLLDPQAHGSMQRSAAADGVHAAEAPTCRSRGSRALARAARRLVRQVADRAELTGHRRVATMTRRRGRGRSAVKRPDRWSTPSTSCRRSSPRSLALSSGPASTVPGTRIVPESGPWMRSPSARERKTTPKTKSTWIRPQRDFDSHCTRGANARPGLSRESRASAPTSACISSG